MHTLHPNRILSFNLAFWVTHSHFNPILEQIMTWRWSYDCILRAEYTKKCILKCNNCILLWQYTTWPNIISKIDESWRIRPILLSFNWEKQPNELPLGPLTWKCTIIALKCVFRRHISVGNSHLGVLFCFAKPSRDTFVWVTHPLTHPPTQLRWSKNHTTRGCAPRCFGFLAQLAGPVNSREAGRGRSPCLADHSFAHTFSFLVER